MYGQSEVLPVQIDRYEWGRRWDENVKACNLITLSEADKHQIGMMVYWQMVAEKEFYEKENGKK